MIAKFSALTPSGIALQSMSFSQNAGKLTFSATAETREDYVAYEKILQASPLFKNIEFPLQTKKANIAFTFTASLVGLPTP